MTRKHKIIFATLAPGLIILFFLILYADKGLIDLLRLREKKSFLMIENSKIGLKLIDNIYTFKRLAKNDLKLIDRLARKQGMVGKDELVLIPREPIKDLKKANPKTQSPSNFRMLTDEEIDELLKFDIKSFKFYEELKENEDESGAEKKQTEQNKTGSDKTTLTGRKDVTSDNHGNVTIQVGAFKDRKNAERLVKKLKENGYQAYIVSGRGSGNARYYRVRIGTFKGETEVRAFIGRLKKDKFKPFIVKN